jgi:hypothetical protein
MYVWPYRGIKAPEKTGRKTTELNLKP